EARRRRVSDVLDNPHAGASKVNTSSGQHISHLLLGSDWIRLCFNEFQQYPVGLVLTHKTEWASLLRLFWSTCAWCVYLVGLRPPVKPDASLSLEMLDSEAAGMLVAQFLNGIRSVL